MKRLLMLAVLSGCPASQDPLIGDWQGRDLDAGKRNTLWIDDSLRGDAVIYFYLDGTPYYAEFDVDVISSDDDHADMRFDCDGNCSALDFYMYCDLDDETMRCDATGAFSTFTFDWRREGDEP